MKQLQLYGIIALLITSIGLGVTTKILYGRNQKLNTELKIAKVQRELAEENLVRVSDQLARETKTRETAEAALTKLRNVPDADYNQALPDSVVNVLDSFHRGLQ